MTTIARCYDLGQAQLLKARLEAGGIPAFIPDEISAGLMPNPAFGKSGVRVQVADEDADRAREVLAAGNT